MRVHLELTPWLCLTRMRALILYCACAVCRVARALTDQSSIHVACLQMSKSNDDGASGLSRQLGGLELNSSTGQQQQQQAKRESIAFSVLVE